MKILIFNWRDTKNPKSGGAEIATMEHAEAWVKSGHDVTWFTSSFAGARESEVINGVRIIRKGNFISVYLIAPFFYFFSGKKFDVVIDQIHGIPFFTPLYVRKPKIAFIHEVAEEIWDYMFPFPINEIGKLIEPFYFKLYRKTFFWVPSNSTIEDLEKHGIERKNCVEILCGLNNKVLSKLPIKEADPTFIFVSRIVKMKGIEDVIKSFLIIERSIPSAKFWIVGSGEAEYVRKLEESVKLKKRSIKFFGYVPDSEKLQLMRKAHLILHASVKEGWGMVIIEAASQATPSIVYNVSGLRDSVHNGKTGIIVPVNSPESMANEAIALLKDQRRYGKFQQECLKWANSLSWKKATEKSLKLLSKEETNQK